jgi:hypothetical protein
MAPQGTGIGSPNALKRPIEVTAETSCAAPASAVYDLLADPATHLVWAGERQGSTSRLLTMDGPPAPIGVGDEFSTTGGDPMGEFSDRSVVTEARRPSAFEFVTDSTLTTRKGAASRWTNVHRYEIDETASGCRIAYTLRVERITSLPGMLRIFNWPVLRPLAVRASAVLPRKGIANLAALAEERSTA